MTDPEPSRDLRAKRSWRSRVLKTLDSTVGLSAPRCPLVSRERPGQVFAVPLGLARSKSSPTIVDVRRARRPLTAPTGIHWRFGGYTLVVPQPGTASATGGFKGSATLGASCRLVGHRCDRATPRAAIEGTSCQNQDLLIGASFGHGPTGLRRAPNSLASSDG